MHLLAFTAPWFFRWDSLALGIFLYWLTGSVGICLGYHRLLTHRSLRLPQWLEYIIVTIGVLALQGGPVFWVGTHRMHHAYTEDGQRDPYAASRGFWWSHVLWLLYPHGDTFNRQAHQRFVPRIHRDRYYRWLETYFLVPQILLAGLLWAVGGWSYVIYGIAVRCVFLWHCTWFVNSATHFWGYQRFEIPDSSANLWWVGILAHGEGWHNNHHAAPNVARSGLTWWEVDVTWWFILLLERLGWASGIKRPTASLGSKRLKQNRPSEAIALP
ncbi:MAG: acyl-CoA desaturase [Synechococcales cyanobacterium RM1_1_8]|nr:acyl-CoA desaturase [Synechococcales cyanobacterium RM1_1_8]